MTAPPLFVFLLFFGFLTPKIASLTPDGAVTPEILTHF